MAVGSVDYFSSNANYGAAGSKFKNLPSNGTYQNATFGLDGSFDLDSDWRLLGGLGGAMAQSDNGSVTKSAANMSDIRLGAQWWLLQRPFWLVPVFKYSYPLQRVTADTDRVMTSEGALTYEGGAWLAKKIRGLRYYFYGGWKYQDENRANLVPWVLAAEYRPRLWYVEGGLRGYETLQGSGDSREAHETTVNRVNAGSLRYYAVNPALREAWGETGFHWRTWQAWLGLAQTFNGRSTAAGFTASVGLLVSFDAFSPEPEDEGPLSEDRFIQDKVFEEKEPESEPSKENFDMSHEKYDEELFREASPVRTEDHMTAPEKPKAKARPRKPKKKGPSTEQLLDKAQKQLEENLGK